MKMKCLQCNCRLTSKNSLKIECGNIIGESSFCRICSYLIMQAHILKRKKNDIPTSVTQLKEK
jgi:hypothetical protein